MPSDDPMIPPPMGDCPVCGEPITPTDNAVWRDGQGGWTHMACIDDSATPPTTPTPTDKEA